MTPKKPSETWVWLSLLGAMSASWFSDKTVSMGCLLASGLCSGWWAFHTMKRRISLDKVASQHSQQ